MDKNCSYCKESCMFSLYNKTFNGVFVNCDKVRAFSKICNECNYNKTCQAYVKGSCADYRIREKQRMPEKSDEQILDYLSMMPSVNCPNESIDLKKLTHQLATDDWYNICKTSDDWDFFKKLNGITKSEDEYIKQDIEPGFVQEANKIIDETESMKPSLKIYKNANQKADDCINCQPETKNRCIHMVLPDGWTGFPDLYMAEALKRRLFSKMINFEK